MKMLAIDSSATMASVAIVTEDAVIAEYNVNYKKTHSQTLMPMLDTIVQMTETDLAEIDYLAIAGGPGSFTGLRIGSATVKGLGLALGKPIVSVPTLEGLAMNLYDVEGVVCPIMDARRGQVYTGIYQFCNHELMVVRDQEPMDIHDVIVALNQKGMAVTFVGDGIPVHEKTIDQELTVPYSFAPAHLNRQRAAAVAMRGWDYVRAGKVQSATEHAPEYLRLSQAERERLEKEQQADV